MKIAIVQMEMCASVQENTSSILHGLEAAKDLGAQVVLFPEFATVGFHMGLLDGISPEEISWALNEISCKCASVQIAAIVGTPYFSCSSEPLPWNAVAVFDEAGQLVYVCPKLDLDEKGEAQIFATGEGRQCFSLLGCRCAIIICREIAWSTAQVQALLTEQPQIIFWPGLVVNSSENEPMAKAIATNLSVWLVQATWPNWLFSKGRIWGRSWVISPSGQIVHESAANAPCVCVIDVGIRETIAGQ